MMFFGNGGFEENKIVRLLVYKIYNNYLNFNSISYKIEIYFRKLNFFFLGFIFIYVIFFFILNIYREYII